ncbi:hypothetical protein SCLARK_001777 [Spiroplasma clarkii]|uniref:Uncharacterized protein n=1 Tax=Spiroplasma clarkii TaxID=2139 RepID=A0A1Y0L2G4_9MOLU|nr:hypothetical protein [Spiroplasma clarkii]ARU92224.1 hypothetical protein SCLARK_001777 [Spiroplasma clarkii]ATX71546.1 hypothetical protein SCLAR_v1c12460 [Spiroplasma clarkii]
MKKTKIILFWTGIGLYFLNQVLVLALLHKVRVLLNLVEGGNYWEAATEYAMILLLCAVFVAMIVCVCSKKPITNQVGAIIGIVTTIFIVAFSWLIVTWIFWFINFIACIIILIACLLILKLNKEIV